MNPKVICMVLSFATLLSVSADEFITIGFEGLSGGQADLPTNYANLNWDPDFDYFLDTQMASDPEGSGPMRITYGRWIDFGTSVTFLGSWIGTFAWGGDKYWRGYEDGELVYESAQFSDGVAQTGRIDVNWENVDYVEIVGSAGSFSMDDIRYTHVVPEPGTLALLSTAGLLLYSRRRMI